MSPRYEGKLIKRSVISFVAVTLARETRGNNLRVVDDSSAPYAERTAGDAPDPRRRS